MKVFISADMEGTCGVVSWVQVSPPEYGGDEPTSQDRYFRTRQRMTAEINAAIAGALAGGADEVIVSDSHNGMRNVIPEELHPAARYMTGSDRPLSIMENVGMPGVAAVFCTGFHAKAGTPAAPLAHTWTGSINDLRFDGVSTGEFGIAAAVAGYYDVPVMMVAGDDKAVAQTQEMLGPQVVGAVVKEGISTFSALHLHPERAQRLIREAAQEAMGRIPGAQPYRLANAVIEVEFDHQARADQAILVPGVVRAGERTVAWVAQDGKAFMQTFLAVTTVAGIATE